MRARQEYGRHAEVAYALIGAMLLAAAAACAQNHEVTIEPLPPETTSDTTAFTLEEPEPAAVVPAAQPGPAPSVPIDSYTKSQIDKGYRLARRGATLFIVGFSLDLGVSLPLSIAGMIDMDPGLLLGAVVTGATATGLKIAGPIRCGVGGSIAHNAGYTVGVLERRPRHWGLYKAGWAFIGISSAVGIMSSLAPEEDFMIGASIVGTSLTVVGNTLWLASCISSLRVSRHAAREAGITLLELRPAFSMNGAAGCTAVFAF